MNKLLQSSANQSNLSATIQGILVGLVPLTIYIASLQGVLLMQYELIQLVDAITTFVASVFITFGLARKVYYLIKNILDKFKK